MVTISSNHERILCHQAANAKRINRPALSDLSHKSGTIRLLFATITIHSAAANMVIRDSFADHQSSKYQLLYTVVPPSPKI